MMKIAMIMVLVAGPGFAAGCSGDYSQAGGDDGADTDAEPAADGHETGDDGGGGEEDAADDSADAGLDPVPDPDNDADIDMPDADASEPPPDPEPYRPCETGSCWDTSLRPNRCLNAQIDENFSSGIFNVHDYASTLYADGLTRLTLTRTGGSWQPALIVADEDGTVLSDGRIGLVRDGLDVSIEEDGTSGGTALVELWTESDLRVSVFVTGWEVVDSGFESFLPTSSTYTLRIENICDEPPVECEVNGHTVREPACGWLLYTGREVVPLLEGSRDERLTAAARVAWWSLKEGVLFLANPLAYSNCGASGHIGPLETCPSGYAWQVGLAGVQEPDHRHGDVEAAAGRLFPDMSLDEVLAEAALEAGLDGADVDTVVASTGDFRNSWLLRSSAVGFTMEEVLVTAQCVVGSEGWCFGTDWDSTRLFAPDKPSAMQAIEDVRGILDAVAP
ncbi:MAG: hypothetical protein ABIJ56_02970 [Pseudomonadota bacterium]